jgi:segregation and condensation protein A
MSAAAVRDLDLDLDAFEGPFDLLLTLVLKDELELADVEVAGVVSAAEDAMHLPQGEIDLEFCGEFLVLVAALLELKARGLFPEQDASPVEELDPEEVAGELAERLALYRRFKAAAGWLEERLAAESDRYFRLGPAPLAPVPDRPLAPQDPQALAAAVRALAAEPPEPSLAHLAQRFPPVSLFLERFRAVLRRRRRFVFDREVEALARVEQAVAFLALLELRKGGEVKLSQAAPFEPITVWSGTSA